MFFPEVPNWKIRASIIWLAFLLATASHDPVAAQTSAPSSKRAESILMEVFVRGDSAKSTDGAAYAKSLADRTPGLTVQVHDVLKDSAQLNRLWKLAKAGGRDKPVVPAFRSCDRMHYGFDGADLTGASVRDLYTVHVYTRDTCPRCKKAKAYFSRLQAEWPALRVQIYEITQDASARQRWQDAARRHQRVPGLPTILFANRILIGYQGDETSGKQIEQLIRRVSGHEQARKWNEDRQKIEPSVVDVSSLLLFRGWGLTASLPMATTVGVPLHQNDSDDVPPPEPAWDDVPVPGDGFDDVPLPDPGTLIPSDDADAGAAGRSPEAEAPFGETDGDTLSVPWLGELRVSQLGLPLFTFLVGLIDGFNPCAMWVLVFLLSILVNIKDRRKIVLIAGTFVVISGLAYYTFMALWLNLFLIIGMARWIQLALGGTATVIGVINVKDFFAFKKGISLSIPESSKPGIYARVRKIVAAEYLTAALMGAVVLAILVNLVEMVCTAGLPAMYTQILTMHGLPAWHNYMYLALYISAYMLDDTVLLTIVVVTLSHRRLQEREGRWLKLISGMVILVLGLVMIFKPTWMQLGH